MRTASMLIKTVLEQYYKDYLESAFLTESEIAELNSLFAVIFTSLNQDIPQPELIFEVLQNLRQVPAQILPIIFRNDDPAISYIEMLHSRELQGDQRTVEWKMQRHNFITASVSAICAGLMGPAARENQLLEKASMGKYSPFKGGYYTDIGNIFEPVTNSYYSYINNTRIHDFALIPSNKEEWNFLAASTDGVAARGTELTNIEIKTLPGRIPDGKIKKIYAHQMQHQMECLGLEHSDFIEVKYEEMYQLPDSNTGRPIGIIAETWDLEENFFHYEYSPAGATVDDLMRWQELRESIIQRNDTRLFVRWIYWLQTHYSCIRVERDPTWLQTVGPELKKFYAEMLDLRKDQKRVQQMIRDREMRVHNKRTQNNPLFQNCMI